MKVSKEDLKELFEQRSEEYLSAFNVTLQRLTPFLVIYITILLLYAI